jgi:hypothetical protein
MPFELSHALLDGVASCEEEEAVQHKSSFESFEFLELPLATKKRTTQTPNSHHDHDLERRNGATYQQLPFGGSFGGYQAG